MPESKRHKLYVATMAAFREAKDAFERNPQPGTGEWGEWEKLMRQAVEANRLYVLESAKQFPDTLPFKPPRREVASRSR
jgi:hypothetical protein